MFPNGYFAQTFFTPTYFPRPLGGTGSFVVVAPSEPTGSSDPVKGPKKQRFVFSIAGSIQ